MIARLALLALLLAAPAAHAQWTRVEGVPSEEVGVVYADGPTLWAGTTSDVYRSADGGATWTHATLPGGVDGIRSLVRTHGRLFAGTFNRRVFVSTDEGAHWAPSSVLTGLGSEDAAYLAVRGDSLYAGTGGAGVFVLNLATPSAQWRGFSEGMDWMTSGSVNAIAVHGRRLVANAGANGRVFLRDPGAPAWDEHAFIAFDPNGPYLTTFLSLGDVLLAAGSHGLFRSLDDGQTWTRFNTGPGFLHNGSLVQDGPTVYAMASRGSGTVIFRTNDAGATWTEVERVSGALTLSLAAHGGRLYAGGLNGLWSRPVEATPAEPAPPSVAVRLDAPSPNPVVGTAQFRYTLPAATRVELAAYDALGRRIAVLAEGSRSAGSHTATWDASDLPAGLYVVRLTAGQTIQTRRVTVAR